MKRNVDCTPFSVQCPNTWSPSCYMKSDKVRNILASGNTAFMNLDQSAHIMAYSSGNLPCLLQGAANVFAVCNAAFVWLLCGQCVVLSFPQAIVGRQSCLGCKCCDAFEAMWSTRARRLLSPREALGVHFVPMRAQDTAGTGLEWPVYDHVPTARSMRAMAGNGMVLQVAGCLVR